MAAGINASTRQKKGRSACEVQFPVKVFFQAIPGFVFFQVAEDLFIPDPPRLLAAAPSGDLHFETVVLDIDAGCQKKNAVRDFCFVSFPA